MQLAWPNSMWAFMCNRSGVSAWVIGVVRHPHPNCHATFTEVRTAHSQPNRRGTKLRALANAIVDVRVALEGIRKMP
jgi:hypothetical protein